MSTIKLGLVGLYVFITVKTSSIWLEVVS